MASGRASVRPRQPPESLRQSDLAEYITGNDPNLTYVKTIGIGGQGQVHIVLFIGQAVLTNVVTKQPNRRGTAHCYFPPFSTPKVPFLFHPRL